MCDYVIDLILCKFFEHLKSSYAIFESHEVVLLKRQKTSGFMHKDLESIRNGNKERRFAAFGVRFSCGHLIVSTATFADKGAVLS
jgi:hypothetical protein